MFLEVVPRRYFVTVMKRAYYIKLRLSNAAVLLPYLYKYVRKLLKVLCGRNLGTYRSKIEKALNAKSAKLKMWF